MRELLLAICILPSVPIYPTLQDVPYHLVNCPDSNHTYIVPLSSSTLAVHDNDNMSTIGNV